MHGSVVSCAALWLVCLVSVLQSVGGVWGSTGAMSGPDGGGGGGLSSAGPAAARGLTTATCSDAALDYLQQHGVPATAESAARGNGSSVCGGGGGDSGHSGGCCSSEVTEALVEAGRSALSDVVKHQAHNLHKLLTQHREHLHGVVVGALGSAHQRVSAVFATTYPRLSSGSAEVLQELFVGLEVALTDPDDTALSRTMDTFWDDLFPPVYHSALHARLPPFDSSYRECLRDVRRTVSPWGIIPALVGEPLVRGLQTARLLLHALDQGQDALAAAQRWRAPRECGEAHARMTLCQACHGAATPSPPCLGLCLNIGRGCLAPLAEVDGAWGDLATAASRAYESLKAAHLTQSPPPAARQALRGRHGRPREDLSYKKKVRRECSSPTHDDLMATHPTPPTAPVPSSFKMHVWYDCFVYNESRFTGIYKTILPKKWKAKFASVNICAASTKFIQDACLQRRELNIHINALSNAILLMDIRNIPARPQRYLASILARATPLHRVISIECTHGLWLNQPKMTRVPGIMVQPNQPFQGSLGRMVLLSQNYQGSRGVPGVYGSTKPTLPGDYGSTKPNIPDKITRVSGDNGSTK
ncbi:unnamed protein product, partial [Meganyctiphanes norvegica]